MLKSLLSLLLFLSVSVAHASPPDDVSLCRSQDEEKRYDCYGSLARSHKIPMDWHFIELQDPIDDTWGTMAILRAWRGESPSGANPALVLRCSSGTLDILMSWEWNLNGAQQTVTYRFGKSSPVTSKWDTANSGDGTFYPGDSLDFLNQLSVEDRLVVRLSEMQAPNITAHFNLTGLTQIKNIMTQTCDLPQRGNRQSTF